MPRNRRTSGCGYLPLAILFLLVLLMLTGVLQVQISPQMNLPPNAQLPGDIPIPDIRAPLSELAKVISQIIPGLQINVPANPSLNNPAAAPPPSIGQRTKTSGCTAHNALPDSACTPGAVFPNATQDQICVSGYTQTVRDVPAQVKDEVYAEYGITQHTTGQYEVDHLIPLELGGSNDIANLWPEPADPRPGFHEKDKVENYLHDQVCGGAVPLQQAQQEIATNWLSAYQGMQGK